MVLYQISADITTLVEQTEVNTSSIATNTSAISALNSSQGTQDTEIATNTSAISALNTSQGTQDTAIATNTSAISALNTSQGTQDTAIATNTSAISALNTSQGTQDTAIATNASAISALNTSSLRVIQSNSIPSTRVDGSALVTGDILEMPASQTRWTWNGTYFLSPRKDFTIWVTTSGISVNVSAIRRGVSGQRKHFIHTVEFNRINFASTSTNNGNIVINARDGANSVQSQIVVANTFTDASASGVVKTLNSVLDTTINSAGRSNIMELTLVNSVGNCPPSQGQFGCLISYSEILA